MSNLMPPLSDEEYADLKESIRVNGYFPGYPIILDQDGDIVDGFHRQQACDELGVMPTYERIHIENDWYRAVHAVRPNVSRRQLTSSAKAQMAQKLKRIHDEVFKPAAKQRQAAGLKQNKTPSGTSSPDGQAAARKAAADATAGPGFNPSANEETFARHEREAEKRERRARDEVGAIIDVSGRQAARYWKRYEKLIAAANEADEPELVEALEVGDIDLEEAEAKLRRLTGKIVDRNAGTLVTPEDAAKMEAHAEASRLYVELHQLPGRLHHLGPALFEVPDHPIEKEPTVELAILSLENLLTQLKGQA